MQSKQEVLKQLGVEENFGLSHQQAAERKKWYGMNACSKEKSDSLMRRIGRAISQPMVILLSIVGLTAVVINVILAYMGREADIVKCIGVLIVIALFVTVTVIIEGKKAKILAACSKTDEDVHVRVIRSGEARLIPQTEIVVGDIVCIVTGDRLPVDGRLIESMSLQVDEASLTGESKPITKEADAVLGNENVPLAKRINMVYSGGLITSGYGRMVVTRIGNRTELSKMMKETLSREKLITLSQERWIKIGKFITVLGTTATAIVSII